MLTQNIKKKRTKDPICSFLKSLISPYGFGWEENHGVGRYSNDQLIRWYNTHGFMGTPTNGDIYAHFTGQQTLYFWADGRMSTPQTLTMIDIDCHKRGNHESARAFADWLSQNDFPDLYHEPSTHGKGRHGYFVLFKEGCNDRAVINILKRLDKTLKKLLQVFLASHPEHEVENVEIKGTPHVITWAKGERRQIESMKSGQLAKLPRDILDRFEEFKNTTALSFDDIYQLEREAEKLVIPGPEKLSVTKVRGSIRKHPISKSEVKAIHGPYLDFARSWVEKPLPTSSRAKVDAADLAIGLAIVKYCTSEINADGTMPTRRIKAIWDGLFQSEDIDRAFDYHRWRVIRELIEVEDGLEMVDRRYYTGFVNHQGQVIKGRAAQWQMAEWLVEKLDEVVAMVYGIANTGIHVGEQGGLNQKTQFDGSLPLQRGERALLEQNNAQELQRNHDQDIRSLPLERGEQALLEQEDESDVDDLFDKNWIIEFRRSLPPLIGLIWAGSVENTLREAG
jgi:hypothetical protein